MTRAKHDIQTKVRNIKLIADNDLTYRSYLDRLKLEHFHLRPKFDRKHSDIISYPLEKAVREWIKASGLAIEERIISYEVLFSNSKFEQQFSEVDAILRQGNKYTLVEVKVTSREKFKNVAKGQLYFNHKLLMKIGIDAELLVLQINLNYRNYLVKYQTFNPDFLQMQPIFNNDTFKYNSLMMSPIDIFEWGVKQGIITNPNLLQNAIDEAELIFNKRVKCQELKDENIPIEDWPVELLEEVLQLDQDDHSISLGDHISDDSFADKLKEALKKGK